MDEKIAFNNSRNEKLKGILLCPELPESSGLIIHGFCAGKDIGIIPKIANVLEENNVLVLRFDLSGYGESEGSFEDATLPKHLEDAMAAYDELRRRTPLPIHVIGHSMGASIAIELALKREVKSIELIAPPYKTLSSGMAARAEQAMKEGTAEFTDYYGKKRQVNKAFFESSNWWNLEEDVKRISVPVLTIIGSDDKNVSTDAAKKASEGIRVHEYVEIPGADHFFMKHDKELSSRIIAFIRNT